MIIVTRAIIVLEDQVLAAQRPETMSLPLLWELPGGKLEPEELPEDCIVRETFEELMLHVEPLERLPHVDRIFREKHYRMVPYICSVIGGKVKAVEHTQAVWQPLDKLFELAWAPAEEMLLREFLTIKHPELAVASKAVFAD
jgi:8-oxo-dGTP diphosphatase